MKMRIFPVKYKWKVFLVFLIVAIIFCIMARVLTLTWSEVPLQKLHFNWIYLVLSFIAYFSSLLFGAYVWSFILKRLGENLTWRKSLQIISLTQVGKYMPGKVWFFAGQAYLAKKEKVSAQVAVASVLLMNIATVIACLLIAFGFMGSSFTHLSFTKLPILVGILLLGLILVHPFVLNKLIDIIRKITKKVSLSRIPMTYLNSLTVVLMSCIGVVIYGIGFYFLINSFYLLEVKNLLPVTGAFSGAWVIGFLSFIMPAGIGVREGLMSYFLGFYMPLSVAIIAAILSRIWITIGEFALFAIFAKGLKKYV